MSSSIGVAGTPAPVPPSVAERTGHATGLRVVEVAAEGPAARAGLRNGDLILTAAGQPIATAQALVKLMLADAIGSRLPITVVRNGALVDIIATPIELDTENRRG